MHTYVYNKDSMCGQKVLYNTQNSDYLEEERKENEIEEGTNICLFSQQSEANIAKCQHSFNK